MQYVQNQQKRHSLLTLHNVRALSSVSIVELEQVNFACVIQHNVPHTIYLIWAKSAMLCSSAVTK